MFAAAVAMKMVGIDRARGLDLFVEGTTDLVAERERQRHQLEQWRKRRLTDLDEVFIVLTLGRDRIVDLANVRASVAEENIDRGPRAPPLVKIGLKQRFC